MRKVALAISCPHSHEDAGPSLSRRGFLGHVMHLGMAAAAASTVLDGYATRVLAAPGRAIKFSHGTGLCNMPLFYAAEPLPQRSARRSWPCPGGWRRP
jgi:hypothetical protein